jgi:glycerophosphoryl diester phosphodiesterase
MASAESHACSSLDAARELSINNYRSPLLEWTVSRFSRSHLTGLAGSRRPASLPRRSLCALGTLALLAGCAARGTAWQALRPEGRHPVVVAHRGASAVAPENTLAAFRTAIATGARAAECDVRLSADGAVVVMHDATLDRTTDGTGPVAERTLAELRTLDAGVWRGPAFAGEPIPELGELLALVAGRLTLFVELKDGDDLEPRVAAVLASHTHHDDVVVISFDADRLARAKVLLPTVPTMLLGRRRARHAPLALVETAVAVHAAAVGVEHEGIDDQFIAAAHAAGLGVYAWTVNDGEGARRLATLGVDGVITDHPDRITAALTTP